MILSTLRNQACLLSSIACQLTVHSTCRFVSEGEARITSCAEFLWRESKGIWGIWERPIENYPTAPWEVSKVLPLAEFLWRESKGIWGLWERPIENYPTGPWEVYEILDIMSPVRGHVNFVLLLKTSESACRYKIFAIHGHKGAVSLCRARLLVRFRTKIFRTFHGTLEPCNMSGRHQRQWRRWKDLSATWRTGDLGPLPSDILPCTGSWSRRVADNCPTELRFTSL